MMNRIDKNEVVNVTVDTLKTRLAHRSVDISEDDYELVWNFVDSILSNYVNDANIHDNQDRMN